MVYNQIYSGFEQGRKQVAVLIDPDKLTNDQLLSLLEDCILYNVDFLFVGTSLMAGSNMPHFVKTIKEFCDIPIICFPGHPIQLNQSFDATLFISLISGRNPDYLIGHHMASAGLLRKWRQEVISTGYMLIDSGAETSASYMSYSKPIPNNKSDIAIATALAGQYLGMKLIYMDAGSGADIPIPQKMISNVKKNIEIPLIIGGGLDNKSKVSKALAAGADVIVIGNALESENSLLKSIKHLIDANYSDIQS